MNSMICPKCGNLISYNSYFGAYYCSVCGEYFQEIKKTNADKIRSMTDEELVNVVPCPLGFSMFRCPIERQCGPCKREWLKQPVEEADHD